MRNNLQLAPTHAALVIIDHFKGQFADKVLKVLELSNVVVVDVPANFTGRLQPMDMSVNKPINKDHMRSLFQNFRW